MPTYKSKQAEKVFRKLSVDESTSNHHRRGFLVDDSSGQKLFPPIYFNKGHKDIYPQIARKMQLCLSMTNEEFNELMCCRMTRVTYFSLRRSRDKSA